jgi:hypothetical protein
MSKGVKNILKNILKTKDISYFFNMFLFMIYNEYTMCKYYNQHQQ